jgi:hypothetical protein
MKQINNPFERKLISDAVSAISYDKKQNFVTFVNNYIGFGTFTSSHKRKCEVFIDILKNNDKDYIDLYEEYLNSQSQYRKANIRHGAGSSEKLKNKYNLRKLPNVVSCFTVSYWMSVGLSEEEAKIEISKRQSENSKKKHAKYKSNQISYKNYLPNCIDYWTSRGYSLAEGEVLRKQISCKSELSYKKYIEKFGVDAGTLKLRAQHEKRKCTMLERYGTTVLNGKTSKESLKFFIPLYKKIRKLGICKTDIYWGISGSREFAHRNSDMNFFYDFTIKSLKITIEYNGIFWHARPDMEWRGFGIKEENIAYNTIKSNTIIEYGHDLYVVWSDDDLELKRKYILQKIKEKLI